VQNFNSNTDNNDEWLTPPYIIEALGLFNLDPCAPVKRPWRTAQGHYTVRDDGLARRWYGRVWCNPPYGNKTFDWLRKLADYGQGTALIFARTETKGFHREIWKRATAIFFFEGRLVFYDIKGQPARNKKGQVTGANAPSCLVAYGLRDAEVLRGAVESGKLKGRYIELQNIF
jgi:hypothetical protein